MPQYVTVSMDASRTIERLAHERLARGQDSDPMLVIEQLEDEAIKAYPNECGINESLKDFVKRFVAARLKD